MGCGRVKGLQGCKILGRQCSDEGWPGRRRASIGGDDCGLRRPGGSGFLGRERGYLHARFTGRCRSEESGAQGALEREGIDDYGFGKVRDAAVTLGGKPGLLGFIRLDVGCELGRRLDGTVINDFTLDVIDPTGTGSGVASGQGAVLPFHKCEGDHLGFTLGPGIVGPGYLVDHLGTCDFAHLDAPR